MKYGKVRNSCLIVSPCRIIMFYISSGGVQEGAGKTESGRRKIEKARLIKLEE
ncbi:MAG: hypothetical protein U5K32_08290 [Bacteroidales bacterium]|nr:hypothetical protein [Bacteroidales bacterium]